MRRAAAYACRLHYCSYVEGFLCFQDNIWKPRDIILLIENLCVLDAGCMYVILLIEKYYFINWKFVIYMLRASFVSKSSSGIVLLIENYVDLKLVGLEVSLKCVVIEFVLW